MPDPRYYADFPLDSQYRGRHFFYTRKERNTFILRAARRGVAVVALGDLHAVPTTTTQRRPHA